MSDIGEKTKQYFIAIIPPSPVFEQTLELKQYFKEQYQTKAALNSPPHITIHMPFRWKEEKEERLVSSLAPFVKQFEPFKVCLDNFSAFPPRVIFINVVLSEMLRDFQKSVQKFCRTQLNLLNSNYRELPFHPHLTLAFRDLKKSVYAKAWDEFKDREFKAEFVADKLALLKHNGKTWDVHHQFTLESGYTVPGKSVLDKTEGG